MGSFRPLVGKNILLVEDEPIISIDASCALHDAGADVGQANCSVETVKLLKRQIFNAALVDICLTGADDCESICDELNDLGVPFAFYTAHTDAPLLSRWPQAPLLSKPATHEQLIDALEKLTAHQPLSPA